MFKNLVGKGHSEFASARQQDAVEYFQHLLETMTRAERQAKDRLAGVFVDPAAEAAAGPTAAQFEFEVEERIACVESGAVRYVVGRGRLTVSKPVLKAPIWCLESALATRI